MSFTEEAKLTALAIVKVFETGKPIGDYSAVAVLKDGAGISYGINQFTHKSGSLEFVLRRYKVLGGTLPEAIAIVWSVIDNPTAHNIRGLSGNVKVKAELKALGKDPLMQRAQKEIAFEKYMKPSIEACEGSDFKYPLSLAVVYDSKNHGSYDRIRDRVQLELPASIKPEEFEREWITEYCKQRKAWLGSSRGVLKNTVNRPQTFLDLIAKGNWNLDLPLDVKLGTGRIRLNPSILKTSAATQPENSQSAITPDSPQESATPAAEPTESGAAENATTEDGSLSPQIVTKERPSIFTRVMTGILGGLGTAFGSVAAWFGSNEVATRIAEKGGERIVENAGRSDLATLGVVLLYIVGIGGVGVFFFWLATKVWEKSSERAKELNVEKILAARSKDLNTVEFAGK